MKEHRSGNTKENARKNNNIINELVENQTRDGKHRIKHFYKPCTKTVSLIKTEVLWKQFNTEFNF